MVYRKELGIPQLSNIVVGSGLFVNCGTAQTTYRRYGFVYPLMLRQTVKPNVRFWPKNPRTLTKRKHLFDQSKRLVVCTPG